MPDKTGSNNHSRKKNLTWTVMVYMAGDNNLAEEMVFALKSMFDVGSTDDVQVVAWSDSVGSPVIFDIPPHKSKPTSSRKDPSHGKPPNGKKPAPVQPPLLVTEDHDLKGRQEAFLKRKDAFAVEGKE